MSRRTQYQPKAGQSVDNLLRTLGGWLADQLGLDALPADFWEAHRGPNLNFSRYMRRVVLADNSTPLVWVLDEVDRLFGCDFGSEVFALFRSWHNERAFDPAGPWARLTLAMAYRTEAHLLIRDSMPSSSNLWRDPP